MGNHSAKSSAMIRTVLVVLVCAAAFAAGNPAAGVKEWRWTPRHATVSPNIMALPFSKFVKTFTPTVRIPGAKAVAGCGPTKTETRIVGGNEATPHAYPWQVALFIDDLYFCGGSIINDEWVLTAAHCMDGAGVVEVVAGAHNIRQAEATQVTLTSTDFFVHENWGSILLRNDLALIRLPESLTWTDEIAPVCLPSYSDAELSAGTRVNPSGWGLPSDNDNSISDVLREVTVPILSNPDCVDVYGSTITDNIICIDTTGGKGTCSGDSGGPMNYVDGGVTKTRGIVSFGSSTGCETGYPDGFTRVINYLDWIETNTGIAVDP